MPRSDLSEERWAIIAPLLPEQGRRAKRCEARRHIMLMEEPSSRVTAQSLFNCFRLASGAWFATKDNLGPTPRPLNMITILAHPTGFEPVTSAFGGSTTTFPKHAIEHVFVR